MIPSEYETIVKEGLCNYRTVFSARALCLVPLDAGNDFERYILSSNTEPKPHNVRLFRDGLFIDLADTDDIHYPDSFLRSLWSRRRVRRFLCSNSDRHSTHLLVGIDVPTRNV